MAAKPEKAGSYDPLLPPEIWREILARLPVKSVLRCRSVCKSWYSLISCPYFISHYSITNKSGNRLLLDHCSPLVSHDLHCMDSRKHDELLGRQLTIVGSCNGLICFFELVWDHKIPIRDAVTTVNFLIWNPAIRKIVQLPSLSHFTLPEQCSHVGFGWDPKTSDYKVVCNVRDAPGLGGEIQKNVCEIFDLSKGVWRRISPLVPSQAPIYSRAECYVNGAVHWSIISDRILLSFNMTDECFREIRMPDCAEFTPSDDEDLINNTQCVAFGGLVHVIVSKMYWGYYDNGDEGCFVDVSKSCSIWAMKECGVAESWIKVSNIDLQSALVSPSIHISTHKFFLWAKGEVLMVHHLPLDDPKNYPMKVGLVLYNTGSRESKHILSIPVWFNDMCQYKESLALM